MNMIYRHQQPTFFYRRPPSSAHLAFFLGLFLKNMFFLATAWFVASIAIRMVVLTLSIILSPPVFVLLLLTFVTTSWSFDALRPDEQSSFPTTTSTAAPFGGRCGQSPCSRGARQRRREFFHRFLQQCQSKCQQQQQTHQPKASSTSTVVDSSTTKREESTNKTTAEERLNNFQQPKQQSVVFERAPFHIEQDDQHVTLSIDVPGCSVNDLNITVDQDGSTLAIAGERKNKIGDAFSFQRKFVLSPTTMNAATVTANVVNGLLIVTIAKKEIPKPRLIAITNEGQDTACDETGEGQSEEEVEEELRIVFEKAPAEEENIVLSTKKPIAIETINDEDEESDPVKGDDHDSWEDVIKA